MLEAARILKLEEEVRQAEDKWQALSTKKGGSDKSLHKAMRESPSNKDLKAKRESRSSKELKSMRESPSGSSHGREKERDKDG